MILPQQKSKAKLLKIKKLFFAVQMCNVVKAMAGLALPDVKPRFSTKLSTAFVDSQKTL